MTDHPASPPDIFDRARRALRRDRAAAIAGDFLGQTMAEQLVERLDDVSRSFGSALVIGAGHAALAAALEQRGIDPLVIEPGPARAADAGATMADEDRLPIERESVDLILWPGGLDSVNDVPGALLRCRLALRPDGLLLGSFIGDGSYPGVRSAFSMAEAGRPAARFHPQISLAAMGDLLQRVGFALPVVDVERQSLGYAGLDGAIRDLRAAAMSNSLAGPVHPLRRAAWQQARQHFADAAGPDGRTVEQVRIVHFSGWAPHPDQPRPARRGSATASLADALRHGGGPGKPVDEAGG